MSIYCSGCDATWTGISRAHCAACHRTFTGVTAFDIHRLDYKCHEPASRGLIERNGLWGSPSTQPADLWPENHDHNPATA